MNSSLASSQRNPRNRFYRLQKSSIVFLVNPDRWVFPPHLYPLPFGFPDQIRFLQRSQTHFIPRIRHTDDVDGLRKSLKRHGTFDADDFAEANPTTCTYSTHRHVQTIDLSFLEEMEAFCHFPLWIMDPKLSGMRQLHCTTLEDLSASFLVQILLIINGARLQINPPSLKWPPSAFLILMRSENCSRSLPFACVNQCRHRLQVPSRDSRLRRGAVLRRAAPLAERS